MLLKVSIWLPKLAEHQREFFEERAGILEYDANMHRDQAEEIAMEQTIEQYNLKD